MTNRIWLLFSALVGAASAIAMIAVMAHWTVKANAAPQAAPVPTEPSTVDEPRSLVVETRSERLEALEREVVQLRAATQSQAHTESNLPPPDPAKEKELTAAHYAELEQRVSKDPVDPTWSRGATNQLDSGLLELGNKAGFVVTAAECRT